MHRKLDRRIHEASMASVELNRSLMSARLSPQCQREIRSLMRGIPEFQRMLREINSRLSLEEYIDLDGAMKRK